VYLEMQINITVLAAYPDQPVCSAGCIPAGCLLTGMEMHKLQYAFMQYAFSVWWGGADRVCVWWLAGN
jgi:hypothetical protein